MVLVGMACSYITIGVYMYIFFLCGERDFRYFG